MSSKENIYRNYTRKEKQKTQSVYKEKLTIKLLLQNYQNVFHIDSFKSYSFENFIKFLYRPTSSSSLGVVRALFGLMMIIDIPDERGLWDINSKFEDPMRCHFPLINWFSPLPVEYMGLLYFIMWMGALGICLGLKFQISCLMFIFPYWYIYLLDKTVWNNHSYLYGLITILLTFTQANHFFSVDALLKPEIRNKAIPLWNYIIIRFQFFVLYFHAGIKKLDPDWIGGYSMSSLSLHWVFDPFRLFLNNEQIDFWIIHIFGFFFDLTVGFFLLIDKTRPVAIIFASAFHLMNSCIFNIGQFPYVCLVTTPIFCNYNWPDFLKNYLSSKNKVFHGSCLKLQKFQILEQTPRDFEEINFRKKLTCLLLALYVGFQLFLPYSHFITQGYNNWTNGLYGYSWDMMVQNWHSNVIVVRVIDNESQQEYFLDPEAWVGNTRYSKHGDMLIQYARCLKKNLNRPQINSMQDVCSKSSFSNISIYVDIWCSLNGRFQQRMFDPRQDLLKAEWDPFKKISWLMPLLSELSSWRKSLQELEKEIFKWSNNSDVLFVADFPGLYLENYISSDFTNVTLTVLEGTVVLEQFNQDKNELHNISLYRGDFIKIKEGTFHKVYTISNKISCYMYTYNNNSLKNLNGNTSGVSSTSEKFSLFLEHLNIKLKKFCKSIYVIWGCLKKIFLKNTDRLLSLFINV